MAARVQLIRTDDDGKKTVVTVFSIDAKELLRLHPGVYRAASADDIEVLQRRKRRITTEQLTLDLESPVDPGNETDDTTVSNEVTAAGDPDRGSRGGKRSGKQK